MNSLQDIFTDFQDHLMTDEQPSLYFNEIFMDEKISNTNPLKMLSDLKNINQSPKYHPEGSVWNHTMLVIDNAATLKSQSNNPIVLMWSALLHDLGKVSATKERNGKITAYDHDKLGQKLSEEFLARLGVEKEIIKSVSKMVRWHMQVLFVSKNLPYAHIRQMLSEVSLNEIALLSLCDRLGRGNMTAENVLAEEKSVALFIEKCKNNS